MILTMIRPVALFFYSAALAFAAPPNDLLLWFDTPARQFTESLPLGNGRLGAMVFGGIKEERIVLNESSVWSGSRQNADRPDAAQYLPEIRRLLLEGKNAEAEKLVYAHFNCLGQGSAGARGKDVPYGSYQTLGNLTIDFPGGTSLIRNTAVNSILPMPLRASSTSRTIRKSCAKHS
jgi:alpha-L-fucosidase 2